MTKTTRAVLTLAAALLGVVVLVGGGSWWALQSTVRAFEPTAWSDDGVPREEAARVFGVRFPQRPTGWRARQVNVQDASFELLARLGDERATRRFLETNRLEVDASTQVDLDAHEEELTRLVGPVHGRRALRGDALEAERFDRVAALLDVEGATWLAIEAREH